MKWLNGQAFTSWLELPFYIVVCYAIIGIMWLLGL